MQESLRSMLVTTWTTTVQSIASLLPRLVTGILIVLAGLIVGRLVRALTLRFFTALRMDRMSDRLGISAFLARGDARYTLAETLATLMYWLVLILALQIMGWVLGLTGLVDFFGQVLGYLPRLVVGVIIVLVGTALGGFFGSAAQVASANSGLRMSRPLGRMVKYAIVFFSVALALEELEIATRLLTTTFLVIVGATCLALAISFGLGCQDLARQTVERWLTHDQDAAAEAVTPTNRPPGSAS
jgi:Mechanosensitive ion channel, conserved TM helix